MVKQPPQNHQGSEPKKPEYTLEQRQLHLSAKIDNPDNSSLADVKNDWVIALGPPLDPPGNSTSVMVQQRRDIMGYKRYKIGRISWSCGAFKVLLQKENSYQIVRVQPHKWSMSRRLLQWRGKCNDVYYLLKKGRSEPLHDHEKWFIEED